MKFVRKLALVACLVLTSTVQLPAQSPSDQKLLSFSALASKLTQKTPKTQKGANKPSSRQILSPVTPRMRPADVNAELAGSDSPSLSESPAGMALQSILSDPTIETVQVADLNVPALRMVPDPLSDSKRAPILGMEVIAEESFATGESPRKGWWARLRSRDGKQLGDALLVWEGKRASGIIRTDTEVLTVRPLADSLVALTKSKEEVSERQLDDVALPVHPAPADGAGPAPGAPVNCDNPSPPITLDLMVLYSPTAKARALARDYDIEHSIEQAEFLMNATFINSDINGRVRVVKTAEQQVSGETDYAAVLQRLAGGENEFTQAAAARKASKADIVIMVVHNDDATNCGRAATIGATASDAFAVVNWQCLGEKYSFAHEIGHLAGAWHDPAVLPSGVTASPTYAQGFTSTDLRRHFATVMAYRNGCAPCGRVWHWSNPDISYGQVATGTKDHNNNACVWRRALEKMSRFGDSLP